MFGDSNLLYWTATKQQLGVAQKREVGDKVLPWNLKRSAPCTPGFLWAKENLPPGLNTDDIEEGASPQGRLWPFLGKYGRFTEDRYRGGSWSSPQGRLWPFLGKYGRFTEDRYRGGSWSSPQGRLWPIVGLPRAPTKPYVHPRSTKCGVYGGGGNLKSVTRGALHPHS